MSTESSSSKINWPQIIRIAIGLATVIFGGGFFYNEVWKSKVLTYTVLPQYNLGDQMFTGLVIENRGRVPLTDIQIILSNLEAPIGGLNIPGPHEPLQIVSGGEGQTKLSVEMPRFSSRVPPLSIYILTTDTVTLAEGRTFLISSKEVVGVPSGKETLRRETIKMIIASIVSALLTLIVCFLVYFFTLGWGSLLPPSKEQG